MTVRTRRNTALNYGTWTPLWTPAGRNETHVVPSKLLWMWAAEDTPHATSKAELMSFRTKSCRALGMGAMFSIRPARTSTVDGSSCLALAYLGPSHRFEWECQRRMSGARVRDFGLDRCRTTARYSGDTIRCDAMPQPVFVYLDVWDRKRTAEATAPRPQ